MPTQYIIKCKSRVLYSEYKIRMSQLINLGATVETYTGQFFIISIASEAVEKVEALDWVESISLLKASDSIPSRNKLE